MLHKVDMVLILLVEDNLNILQPDKKKIWGRSVRFSPHRQALSVILICFHFNETELSMTFIPELEIIIERVTECAACAKR